MIKRLFLALALLALPLNAKSSDLSAHTAKKRAEEILSSHVTHKEFTPFLAKRALSNFIYELDPAKCYFIRDEIAKYEEPSDELLEQVCHDFAHESFAVFEEISTLMEQAIARRNEFESLNDEKELPKDLSPSLFKEIKWAERSAELQERLLQIRALQLDSAEQIETGAKDRFLQRITKMRKSREADILDGRQGFTFLTSLKAIASALDNHTAYFTPSEAQKFLIQVQQRLFGIGAQLRDDLNGYTLVRLLDGGPALQSERLKVNDRIIAVNKEPIIGMELSKGVDLIRGPKGSAVTLTILRQNEGRESETFDVDIVRDEIVIKEARYESKVEPFGDGVIAHISLFSFYQDPSSSSADDIRKAFEEISKKQTVHGVILDLRNNSGGVLPQAVAVTGLFIKKGIVVSVKDNTGSVQHMRNFEESTIWDGPLIVLTDKGSASAAEIVAGSLSDYGRALIVGDETTFGKGSYQTLTLSAMRSNKVNPLGEYKVTRGLYYTVSGKSPQLTGAKADITVPGFLSFLDVGESHSKYPLECNEIEPNFVDTFADIHPFHRSRMQRLAKEGAQEKLDLYAPYLSQLKKNSEKRIELNQNYQNFLAEVKKEEFDPSEIETYGQNDLQLEETYNVMKDLILLSKKSE